ncbi:MAG: aminoacyltransferase, partial [Candidatus Thermoplasmatota archaeon]|nr:aminoacyltransferase [Candidatus Thermoplasmatota archaeon]
MKLIREVKEQEWRDFVREIPEGNIFQTPEMARVYEKTQGYEPIRIFAVQNGEIQGVLLATLLWTG